VVNYRTTERGMARERVIEANKEAARERRTRTLAQRESALWQAYAGDLEYRMRQANIPVPKISAELRRLAFSDDEEEKNEPTDWDSRLRRQQHDEMQRASHGNPQPNTDPGGEP